MAEQIALAHLHGVSAAQMKLRLGPLPLAKPAVRTHSPQKWTLGGAGLAVPRTLIGPAPQEDVTRDTAVRV